MTKVSIGNFQSIKKAEFFIDGFTVIVGKNNIGKSAIIRAIDATLSNQSGKEFIRYGEKQAEVRIIRIPHNSGDEPSGDEPLDIDWKKGDSSFYKVNNESFSKLNRSVPQPILDAGFEKIEIGDQKVNPLYASQFEPLFLLDKPGQAITEVLSKLYKLNVISSADDKCQKDLKSCRSTSKVREEDLKSLQEKIEGYKDFEIIKDTISVLAKMESDCSKLKAQISELAEYEQSISDQYKKVNGLQKIVEVSVPPISECETSIGDFSWLNKKYEELMISAQSVKRLKDSSSMIVPEIGGIEHLIKDASMLETWDVESRKLITSLKNQRDILQNVKFDIPVDPINSMVIELKLISEYESLYRATAIKAKETRDELKISTDEYTVAQEEEKAERAKFNICPFCDKPL